jgi:uncharacterized membrane protein YgcG
MKRLALIATLLIATFSQVVMAMERIQSYHSDIEIFPDGSMLVTEEIRVRAEGKNIRRGIYRDFPTVYSDRFGNERIVDFELLEVLRNGEEESWHLKRRLNGVRIYVGDADRFVSKGMHTYSFLYRTDWQLGFFEEFDELYWNVTGNGWDFYIDKASARISLPGNVGKEDIKVSGYTGKQGSRDQHYVARALPGIGEISTQGILAPNEGLTLVMSWPKGIVTEPTGLQRIVHLLWTNRGLLLALITLFGCLVYLGVMWNRHGRDPKPGVIFPHYEPPKGYSPASLRYVQRMGYDNETFTAAVINLAVKGYLKIEMEKAFLNLRKEYTLRMTPSDEPLSAGEKELLAKLFRGGAVLSLEKENHEILTAAKKAHKEALARDYKNTYFKLNGILLLPSAIISLLVFGFILFMQPIVPLVFACIVAVIILHALFLWLMKAPSRRGRRLTDQSEGFKLYLNVAEKDELNLRNPPQKTPELFEKYLPFAIALGVEQAWSEKFSAVLARIQPAGGGSYHPVWYSGQFDSSDMAGFTHAVGGGLNSAISSAATPPGSSSGGGGFSGGGGGGGGGGGW